MPADQARSFLATLLSGGGRGDPYANERSGPFAQSPRIYGSQSPARAAPAAAKAVPKPTPRPSGGGGGGGAKKKAAAGPRNIPLPATNPRNSPTGTYTIGAEGNMPPPPGTPPIPQTMAGGDRLLPNQVGQDLVPNAPFVPPAFPHSPTPPTAAMNMASGAGNGMGGNQFDIPSPSTSMMPHRPPSPTPQFGFPPRPTPFPPQSPMPYGGPMAAADMSPQKRGIIQQILSGLGG